MGVLFIFIFISILVISALLFFNKGEKAQEIKTTLKNIYENIKELFSNLKKLFLIIKDLIQEKLDTNSSTAQAVSSSLNESTSSKEVAAQKKPSNNESNVLVPEVTDEEQISSTDNLENSTDSSLKNSTKK